MEFDPLQGSDIQFGKFKGVESFEGLICDSSISFFSLTTEDIAYFFEQGRNELKKTKSLSTSKELFYKSEESYLRETFSKEKKVPQEIVDEINVEPELLKKEEKQQPPEDEKIEDVSCKEQLRKYFLEYPEIEEKCNNKLLY